MVHASISLSYFRTGDNFKSITTKLKHHVYESLANQGIPWANQGTLVTINFCESLPGHTYSSLAAVIWLIANNLEVDQKRKTLKILEKTKESCQQ